MLRILSRCKATETRIIQFVEIRNVWIGGIVAYADRTVGEVFVHPFNIIGIPV